jgi:hypothetical protein
MGSPGRREAPGSETASRQRVLAQLQAEMATARERVVAAPLDGVGGGSDSGDGDGDGDGDGSSNAPSQAADTGEALSPFRRLSSGRFSSSPKHVAQKGRHAFRPPPVGAATSLRARSFDHGSTSAESGQQKHQVLAGQQELREITSLLLQENRDLKRRLERTDSRCAPTHNKRAQALLSRRTLL